MTIEAAKSPDLAKQGVLIVGGGISGVTAALELAGLGIAVTLVEKGEKLGGLAASFCCKADEACNKCFACVVDKRLRDINSADISILRGTELTGIESDSGTYRVTLASSGKTSKRDFAAVIFAAGIDPFDAHLKGEYGYGYLKNVLTARDLEAMLREKGAISRPSDGAAPQRMAFFQCVGSRDLAIGNLFCSQVCCAYALRLIRLIRHTWPEIKIIIYYMDIQPAGVNFADFLSKCRADKNVRFIRSIPSKVYQAPATDSLSVKFVDPSQGEVKEELFDMVILSVGMTFPKDAKLTADLLGFSFDDDGFIIAESQTKNGIFATGACTGPKDIERSITEAKSTAAKAYQFVMGLHAPNAESRAMLVS